MEKLRLKRNRTGNIINSSIWKKMCQIIELEFD